MPFTLAISAATPQAGAALTRAALGTDPGTMPVPGPPVLAWQSPDQRTAIVHWGTPGGSIWADEATGTLNARTSITRVDPVYLAEQPDAVILSDRASWAANVAGRQSAHDPVLIAAMLNLGFALGEHTPYLGVRALAGGQSITVIAGRLTRSREHHVRSRQSRSRQSQEYRPSRHAGVAATAAATVAAALIDAVLPLADATAPVEVSLTGGKDSRLIAAALTAARVPFRARTHGAPDHPDVLVAAAVADRLGIEHIVTAPRPPETVTTDSVLARLRTSVVVTDGMLSAFENTGSPGALPDHIHAGGHGGELLRGGYATYARNPARGAVQFRRLTTRRLPLLRPAATSAYLAALLPWTARFARAPLATLDDFYLVNRAGRWSAAARQAYLLRERLVQPFFDDAVVRAARAVPLRARTDGSLYRDLLAELCPGLLGIPLAGRAPARADWRRGYGDDIAAFLRGYVLDSGGALFEVVRRPAAERALRIPHADPDLAWLLATLAAGPPGDSRPCQD
jgi:asparagine synthetase B (glutamine-hydrolysing)